MALGEFLSRYAANAPFGTGSRGTAFPKIQSILQLW
jgi:hypothetical protein